MNSDTKKGIIIAFLATLLWSLNTPLVKFITLDAYTVAGLRAIIAGVCLLPFSRLRRLRFSKELVVYLLSFAALCIAIIVALQLVASSVAVGMQYTSILWLFIPRLLHREKIPVRQILASGIIIAGVVFFMFAKGLSGNPGGIVFALSIGVLFALTSATSRSASNGHPLELTCAACLVTAAAAFAVGRVSPASLLQIGRQELFALLALGCLQMAGGYLLYNLSLRYISSQKASVVCILEMILGAAWSALFLNDIPTPAVLLGFALTVVGVLLYFSAERGETA